jgi:hypothetical protein
MSPSTSIAESLCALSIAGATGGLSGVTGAMNAVLPALERSQTAESLTRGG